MSLSNCSGIAATGHHLVPKGAPWYGDDLPENIIPVCGSGTTGCHGLIESGLGKPALARNLIPEEWSYLVSKMGSQEAAVEWLSRTHFVPRGEIRDLYIH